MTASLLGAAVPGFDRPLEVLEACHGRIARQCDTLEKLLAHLPAHGAAAQAQQAARRALQQACPEPGRGAQDERD